MEITETELKMNLGKYLDYQGSDDIVITKNGKITKILSNPNKRDLLLQFVKSVKTKKFTLSDDEIKEMRIRERFDI